MPDGRYILRNCVPEGNFDIANVDPGNVLSRAYTFRCNAPMELSSALDSGAWDFRNILRGSDGVLQDDAGNTIAQVNRFQLQANINRGDYQPAGSKMSWSIFHSYHLQLTFTETVWRDADVLVKILNQLAEDAPGASGAARVQETPLTFVCVLRGRA